MISVNLDLRTNKSIMLITEYIAQYLQHAHAQDCIVLDLCPSLAIKSVSVVTRIPICLNTV